MSWKNFFDEIPFSAISKMAKNQYLNWEKVKKLPEMQSYEKKMIYLISRVFLPGHF